VGGLHVRRAGCLVPVEVDQLTADEVCFERPPLRRRQLLDQTQNRMQKLMQTREAELRLGLDGHRGQSPKANSVRASARVVQ
jgi:hypothetical protein